MMEVVAHVYDVTNSGSEKANNTILHINRFFKDGIGVGGIFHSSIQVYGDEEWSFGFCEYGSGVFSCQPCKNPMYTYRESIVLGETTCSIFTVNQILRELSREWRGSSYDLFSRNCNHFCDAFCEMLDVPKLPGQSAWVNRLANAGDAAMEVAEITAFKLQQAKAEIINASRVAYKFISGVGSNAPTTSEGPSDSGSVAARAQGTWFRNLFSNIGVKPSSSNSSFPEDFDDEEPEDEPSSSSSSSSSSSREK
nr:PREDICTED: uncharacterized protein LOC103973689 isoform X1 [Musa acuminata subsp. malaccensis]